MTVLSLLDIISIICILEGLNSFLYHLCFPVSRWSRAHRHSGGSPQSSPMTLLIQPWEHLYCRGGLNTCEWSHKSGRPISPALWVRLCSRPTVPKESQAYVHIHLKSCDVSWGQKTLKEHLLTLKNDLFNQWIRMDYFFNWVLKKIFFPPHFKCNHLPLRPQN